uniref:hypothetical protein n=1 Tax=Candidatus Cryptobacteroides bacterium TaxID=3085639 RepID=UPI00402772CF
MRKWIKIIWLIISVIAFILVILMIINTLVSYKYEISERMILGNMMRGFDSVPIEVAAGYLNGTLLVLKGFVLYIGINILFITITLFVKNDRK